MTTHATPGPWTVEDGEYKWVSTSNGDGIARVYTGLDDARLIAAAPALLEALIKVLGSATEQGGLGGAYLTVSGDTYRQAKAAIRAAKGNS